MQEDRERCLAAGMDAYLSKPLQAPQLFQLIDSLVPGTCPCQKQQCAGAPGGAVFDQQATLARVKGDREMSGKLSVILRRGARVIGQDPDSDYVQAMGQPCSAPRMP